ncbi:MAG: hypothetical protein ACRD2Y_07465 [Terriglobales bacterium]
MFREFLERRRRAREKFWRDLAEVERQIAEGMPLEARSPVENVKTVLFWVMITLAAIGLWQLLMWGGT